MENAEVIISDYVNRLASATHKEITLSAEIQSLRSQNEELRKENERLKQD